MSEAPKNGAAKALVDLIRNSGLDAAAMQEVRIALRRGRGPTVNKRTGPQTRCKKGDRVTVTYEDGTVAPMTVWAAGTMTLKLSTLSVAQLTRREANLRARIMRDPRSFSAPRFQAGQPPAAMVRPE